MKVAVSMVCGPILALFTAMTMCSIDENYTHLDGCIDSGGKKFRANDLYKCSPPEEAQYNERDE